MKRAISVSQLLGFAVTSLFGTLLHFLYEWTGEGLLAAPFSGVNESTWEHMKLLFFPTFLFAIAQYFFFREREDFWCVKLLGALLGLVSIPVLFYTYNGAIGKSPDWINIAIFFVAVAIAYLFENALFKAEKIQCKTPLWAFLALCLIAVLFVVFTFAAPRIGLFEDPVTGSFGIPR